MPLVIGDRCVNKRNGKKGTVIATSFDGSMVVRMDGELEELKLSAATVKRWYRLIEAVKEQDVKVHRPASTLPALPKGEAGCGEKLFNTFRAAVKGNIPEGDDFVYRFHKKSNTHVFELNGKNIFEVTYSRHRMSVLANPKHMTPEQLAAAYTVYPKERNWVLAARYIFTNDEERPLMRSIALSGIYGRSRIK